MNCPNKEVNAENCTCTNKECQNWGLCCKCVENHRKKGGLPACLRQNV